MIFDLHTHTNLSSCAAKENTWESLLDKAESENIKVLSITDHNTVGFYENAKAEDIRKHFTGKIIPGIEFSVAIDGVAIELLAYNFDIDIISKWAFEKYGTPRFRQEKIKNELESLIQKHGFQYDYNAEFGDIYAHEFVLNNLLKYESNRKMLESYNVFDRTDFYRISGANTEFPLYFNVDKIWPTVDEVADIVRSANGVVVFAHPYNYNEKVDVDAILSKLLTKDIDGIEVYHPSCDKEKCDYLEDFAISHNLIITGGSDYHGVARHMDLGVKVDAINDLQYWRNI